VKKKLSFMQILITIFTTILIVSFIFTFYILYYQQKSIVYSDIKNGLNEDSKDIKTYLDLTYKTIKLNDNSNINCEGYMKILEYVLKNNNFDSDGILIKDLDNNKIFYIKGNKKELFPILISNSIQTIKLNDTEYVVKHFLYKNEIFNFDIILYSNISKVHYMVWNKIKKNFLLTIIFIVIILFILNILYNNLLIKPTNKLIDTMKLIVQEKKFYKIKDKFLVREVEDIKTVFNQTIEDIGKEQVETEELLKKVEYQKNLYVDIFDSLDTLIVVTNGSNIKNVNQAFFELFDEFKNIEEFTKVHSCVCDYFIKEKGFVYAFDDKNWAEYLIEHPEEKHKVKIQKGDKTYIFKITANRLKRYKDIVVTMSDITQLEKAKVILVELNNYLNQFIDLINKSTIVSKTDVKGIITYANEEFCRISGYSKEELIGQPHNIVRHPDTPK
jgi:PAS domain-containing protein